MVYTLSEPFRLREFSNWRGVFESLSLDEFNEIVPYVHFPFATSEPVRQVCRDFVIAEVRGNRDPDFRSSPCPIEPETDLLRGLPEDIKYSEKSKVFFSTTFSRFEELGCATAIYDWGRTAHLTYPSRNVDALVGWHILLRSWLIVELKQENPYTATLDRRAVQRLMGQELVARVHRSDIQHELDLPAAIKRDMMDIILKAEDDHQQFRSLADGLNRDSDYPWTRFLSGFSAASSWLRVEGRFRLKLEEWRTIESLLSSSEMMVLEHWAKQHNLRQYRYLIVPMPDF